MTGTQHPTKGSELVHHAFPLTWRLMPLSVAFLLLVPLHLSGLGTGSRTGPRKHSTSTVHSTSRRRAATHSAHGKTVAAKGTSASHRRRRGSRSSDYRQRVARIHLEPQRVEEIQRALAQSGYLHEEPNGTWDTQTRAAMQQYQRANGFSSTGLPDSRSLMKMGLGPHPLPAAADPASKTTADSSSLSIAQPHQSDPAVPQP